jgi:hypothetical protein
MDIELQLDTGSGRGLAIGEMPWDQIRQKIPEVRLSKAVELYPYIGRLPCRQGIIPRFRIGNRTIDNAGVSVFPDNSPLLQGCSGLLGMQYFRDTVIVLDFERKLMWLRNVRSR